ncbi:SusD/RagB family nutrient-binding outer membrane lipoprotein [Tamlana haliotis]|uniref:SusD/RagB family nutrient-binding outer membrane lipoprotein n=1 Tax=Pseudotamlana haliotis TaxID=2614804 RepID=A0A6N6MCS1_9FLAO|nr:SusD/RagB family nutrient-binding outer membrane lipoprotein [Tamlana haliotis]KAB1067477.1 SusD/RagB family nutrient-binding outer membrane lipoprotein [Tamlana haliotis]
MKKYIYKIALFTLVATAWNCDSYLDVNHDPDVLEETDSPEIILPSAQASLGNNLMGWDFGFAGGFWNEYWTQTYTASQFKTLCEYDEDGFDNQYRGLTSGTLSDLDMIKKLSGDTENQGYYYIAEALSIYTWQVMTDVWGDIPYTEALQGNDIKSPVFDSSESIYADLIARTDDLLAIDNSMYSIKTQYDFIYAGDMTEWKKFVATLKLKLMLRQSETSGYNNGQVLAFVNANSFLTNSAKIDGSYWDDSAEGKRHPMREFQEGGASYLSTNVIGCKTFVDYLRVNSDPRLDTLFEAPSSGHEGAFFGDFDSKADSDSDGTPDDQEDYSTPVFAGDMDLMLMSDWEVYFYLAEVYTRASDMTNAKAYYDMAVEASLTQNGIADNSIVTSGYATWTSGSVEDGIKMIAMQKWVANANYQHIESFLERNRTKYPSVSDIDIKADRQAAFLNFPVGQLTISVNGREKLNGLLPASPVYPSEVINSNTNAPGQKVNLLEKIWWNQKAGK